MAARCVLFINARVLDPETGLDGVRNVLVRGGTIEVVSERPLDGGGQGDASLDIVDCKGLCLAPGFVDLHSHAMDVASERIRVRDGVTSQLECEFGVHPFAPWLEAQRRAGHLLNYGATAGHIPARLGTFDGASVGHLWTNDCCKHMIGSATRSATSRAGVAETRDIVSRLRADLHAGAVGIGMGIMYTPKSTHEEVLRMFELAGSNPGAVVFVHTRGSQNATDDMSDFHEVIADATAAGAALHICHCTSTALHKLPLLLEMIDGIKRNSNVDVTTEAYSYDAGMTRLDSAVFDTGWEERNGCDTNAIEWMATGERLTPQTFQKYRSQGGMVVLHCIPQSAVEAAMRHPSVIIASDSLPYEDGKSHPRTAGCYARVLGTFVREKRTLSLLSAVNKMSLLPVKRLEKRVPALRRKGRIQPQMDADIVIFDPATVASRATYQKSAEPSAGILHVMVNGVFVVRNGKLLSPSNKPGRPLLGVYGKTCRKASPNDSSRPSKRYALPISTSQITAVRHSLTKRPACRQKRGKNEAKTRQGTAKPCSD